MNVKTTDLSVVITAHAEGILLHRTLRSVLYSCELLDKHKITWEILVHVDNGTPETLAYIKTNEKFLRPFRIFYNSFGDLGSSRNFAVERTSGKYVSFIDADDLMSQNWLLDAYNLLEKVSEPTVAHSELTLEFEGANNLVTKHGEIDYDTDSLLSVFANRWNAIIVVSRKLLLEVPYSKNSPGYGYEDWNLNCRLIAKGVHNVLVPQTVIFVRRKASNSEWLRQTKAMAVLPANPLLSFANIRHVKNVFASYLPVTGPEVPATKKIKARAIQAVKKYPVTYKLALGVHRSLKQERINVSGSTSERVPKWLQNELLDIHRIEHQLFPSEELVHHIQLYDSLTDVHKKAGALYKSVVDNLRFDHYDYLLFVPWLVKGGADQYAINYANTIAKLRPTKKVLVIATLPVVSGWQTKLDEAVDFLDFGNLTTNATPKIKQRLTEHLVENGGATHLHIINSEFGYEFVRLHAPYLEATGKKVVVTSFSQSVDKTGQLYGYSHTHVPLVYDVASLITSDNQAVIDMWQKDYGFDASKLEVHRQPIEPTSPPTRIPQQKPLRILWAARVAPEKQPELLKPIGQRLEKSATIDVFGSIESACQSSLDNLPANVVYKGNFDGLESLPLQSYDVLLYTSLFDGMPNTLLEAAQAKLPIIASAVGGIPEFIKNNKTGLLVKDIKNADAYVAAINQLIRDIYLGAHLANQAYDALRKNFSPAGYKKQVIAMLQKLSY